MTELTHSHRQEAVRARNRVLFEGAVRMGRERYVDDLGLVYHYLESDGHVVRDGGHVAQESLEYAIALAEVGEDAHLTRRIVETTLRHQDRRKHAFTYGNFFWMDNVDEVRDPNAVSFMVPNYHYLLTRHPNVLGDSLVDQVLEALATAAHGLLGHRCQWAYGNIFLLNILAELQIAHLLDDSRLRGIAYHDFEEWLSYTDRFGITEFNSPTYTGVQMTALEGMLDVPCEDRLHHKVRRLLDLYYSDMFLQYHPRSDLFAGPKSRTHFHSIRDSFLHVILFKQTGGRVPPDDLYNVNQAITDCVPPDDVVRLAREKDLPLGLHHVSSHNHVTRTTWMTNRYALSSMNGGRYGPADTQLEVLLGEGSTRCATHVRGDPHRFELFSGQSENAVVGGFRWRFRPEEDLGIADTPGLLTPIKVGWGSPYVPAGKKSAVLKLHLATGDANPTVLINGRPWDGTLLSCTGRDWIVVIIDGVCLGFRTAAPQRYTLLWEEDVVIVRMTARRPRKAPWTVIHPVFLVVETEEEVGSRKAFVEAFGEVTVRRSTRGCTRKLKATWRERTVVAEVPVKPLYLMDDGERRLPESRLADVAHTRGEIGLWSDF